MTTSTSAPAVSSARTLGATLALALLATLLSGPPVRAGSEIDHPAQPPTSPAEPGMATVPAPAADPLAIDPIELWMSTYYRDPSPERIPEMIRELAAAGALAADAPRSREYLRFFAAALADEPGASAELRRVAETVEGQDKAILLAVAVKAEHYAPAVPEAPADLPLLWAEFRATGDREVIVRLVKLLLPAEGVPDLAAAAAANLYDQVPRHKEARYLLGEVLREAPEPLRARAAPLWTALAERGNLSEVLGGRGYNLRKAGKEEEAIAAYRAAIELYPSEGSRYRELANIYLDGKDASRYEAGAAAYRIGAAWYPEDSEYASGVGYCYYRLKRYDEAERWLQRARELDPKDAYPVYYLGKLAWIRRDAKAAFRLYREYLALDPAGSRLNDTERSWLASGGVRVNPRVVPTHLGLLLSRMHEQLELELGTLLRERGKDEWGRSALLQAYDTLTKLPPVSVTSEDLVRAHELWVEQRPKSPLARAALGSVLYFHAWEARGGDFAATVLEAGSRQFTERLLAARKHLEEAWRMDPANPVVPYRMIQVARGLGLGREEGERWFERAVAIDPDFLEAYQSKLFGLYPKWGGSAEEALAFARAVSAQAPPGTERSLLLLSAHRELDDELQRVTLDRSYYRRPGVWAELRPVFERYLAIHPENVAFRNRYARLAYRAGEFSLALEQLELLGDKVSTGTWGGFSALKRAKREMAAK